LNIIDPKLEEYLHRITPSHHEVLREMESLAEQREFPIVGPLVGRILYQYARLLYPSRILELGSGYGYSALWWALGSADNCKIDCTEGSADNIRLAQQFLSRAGVWQKIKYHQGDALEFLSQAPGEFDVIFMDIDKHQYPDGFRKAFSRLRKGGLFVTDNVLWSGRIVEPDPDRSTRAILEYNQLVYNTPGAFTVILPVRDGVGVTLKQ